MRADVLAIWLLPAFCEDLTAIATSNENLTSAGENLVTAFVWILVVGLWMAAVSSFMRRERKRVASVVTENGILVTMDGKEFILVPEDEEMRREVQAENRRARQIERLRQQA